MNINNSLSGASDVRPKLSALIKDMCPHGVEWKTLGKVTYSIKTGLNPRTNFVLNADGATHYYVTVKEITTGKILFSDKTDRITEDARQRIQERSLLEKDDILFSGIGTIGKVAIVDIPTENWNCSESVYLIKPVKSIVVPKYLMYFLGSVHSKEQYESLSVGSTLKGVRKNVLEAIEIPLPPLEIQEKIVECLDKFSALAAELQAELQMRRKQYEYYRTQLLTPHSDCNSADKTDDCNWEWKTLGEISRKIVSGGTPARNHAEYFEGTIPWMRTQEVDWQEVYDTDIHITEEAVKNSSAKLIPANCVIIAMYGATAGKSCINKIPVTTNQACCNLEIDPAQAMYKYVYYWVCKEYENIKGMGEGSQNNINGQKIKSYKIPIPSLAEQARIVAILDKFEALTTSLSDGIPAEQAAQQKRYEYYRDKLLTFEKRP